MERQYEMETIAEFLEYLGCVPEEAYEEANLIEMIEDAKVMGIMKPELANLLLGYEV